MIRMLVFLLTMILLALPVQAQDEWFDKGDVKFRIPGGKWEKAAIHLSPGKVEVFRGRGGAPVATITDGVIEYGTVGVRRTAQGVGIGVGGAIGVAIGYALAKQEEGDITIRDGRAYQKTVSGKATAGIAAGVLGVSAIVAMTKSQKPYAEITNGRRTIEMRVGKDDVLRFENTLDAIELPAPLPSAWWNP